RRHPAGAVFHVHGARRRPQGCRDAGAERARSCGPAPEAARAGMRRPVALMSILRLPANACDCHVHVFEPARFPYASWRAYTPPAAEVGRLQDLHGALGVERVVLVQPSVYGVDNDCMLDALHALGTDRARGVAVVDLATVSDTRLRALHAAGVRGARLNLRV